MVETVPPLPCPVFFFYLLHPSLYNRTRNVQSYEENNMCLTTLLPLSSIADLRTSANFDVLCHDNRMSHAPVNYSETGINIRKEIY
ncbi:hypothetical protein NPIL_403271 [Nephila pilipes]|uniref:Uncharacterized protein n=1 Tax=Nephila pilipes TaxID=299642 RepID=A0A8X6TAP1_NEPPI|nr:hypothetical protein NPIL_403271 [Nephila pilipes]